MKCKKCGYELTEGWVFCGNCGAEVSESGKPAASASPRRASSSALTAVPEAGGAEAFAPPFSQPMRVPEACRSAYGASWALVIGISQYGREPALPWVKGDVARFGELVDYLAFPPQNVITLLDGEATHRRIMEAIEKDLAPRMKLGDRLLMLFAGRVVDRITDSMELETLLVPSGSWDDADPCVCVSEIQRLRKATGLHHCFVLIDAPSSGLADAGQAGGAIALGWQEAVAEDCCQFLVAAQTQQPIAMEGACSVFMESVARGVSGAAQDIGENVISGSELGRYVSHAVDAATHGRQTPYLRTTDGRGDFLFVPAAEGAAASAAEAAPAGPELTVTSEPTGVEVAINGAPSGRTPLRLPLPLGRYEVKASLQGHYPALSKVLLDAAGPKACHFRLERLPADLLPPGFEPIGDEYDAATRLPRRVRRVKDDAEMVLVPGGIFLMGFNLCEPDERPVHAVHVASFYIDRFAVTNRQYERFLQETGYEKPLSWKHPPYDGPTQPVVGVSWKDVAQYCKWAGVMPPSEAQWEKAARGSDRRLFAWGNEEPSPAVCRFRDCREQGPAPVDAYPNNVSIYGVEQLSGNVWEWCLDWYDPQYYASSHRDNPVGPPAGQEKVIRGGAWNSPPLDLRTSARGHRPLLHRSTDIGFRCAINVTPPKHR